MDSATLLFASLALFFSIFYLTAFLCPQPGIGSVCGHRFFTKGIILVLGEELKYSYAAKRDYCPECEGKMAVPCTWCRKPIRIGDMITLYSPGPTFSAPSGAVIYSEAPLRLVGCLRWNCADSGADRAGFWVHPGKVHRVPTAYEDLCCY